MRYTTVYIDIIEIKNVKVPDPFCKTNFDLLIEDRLQSLKEFDFIVQGSIVTASPTKLLCTITYMSKDEFVEHAKAEIERQKIVQMIANNIVGGGLLQFPK